MLSINVPVKLCRTVGSIHLFKITEKWTPEDIKLKRNIFWDVIKLYWKEVNMTLNGEQGKSTSFGHYTAQR